ncbi:hypothetical protein [Amycolatopsis coloradensis]|uniref:hypothetical protein n=1 Tax=Amycolatopsis coloradensis TaxID=76021 RepID=UPI00142DEB97|nr:hypothetical protein [Amycolatopsis coloradensis]
MDEEYTRLVRSWLEEPAVPVQRAEPDPAWAACVPRAEVFVPPPRRSTENQ